VCYVFRVDLCCTGYDGIQEFVPAILELVQSKLASVRATSSDSYLPKLEMASAFRLPLIREDNHAELAAKADQQQSVKLCNGSITSSALHACVPPTDSLRYVESVVVASFRSHCNGDATNGAL